MNVMIPEAKILQYIESLLRFPNPTICRHLVAADLLSMMEELGWRCPEALAKAVVDGEDELAILELKKIPKGP